MTKGSNGSSLAPPAARNGETSTAPHRLIDRLIDWFVFGEPRLGWFQPGTWPSSRASRPAADPLGAPRCLESTFSLVWSIGRSVWDLDLHWLTQHHQDGWLTRDPSRARACVCVCVEHIPHVRQQPIGRLVIGSSIRGGLTSSRLTGDPPGVFITWQRQLHESGWRANQMPPYSDEWSVIGRPGNSDT